MSKAPKPAVTGAVQRSAVLEIDGRSYDLVFDYNSVADAEALTGVNLLHGISAAMFGTVTAAQLRGLLFASLKPRNPDITLQQAGELISIGNLKQVYTALSEAWSASVPPQKAEGAAAKN